jgi:hypothetical protein
MGCPIVYTLVAPNRPAALLVAPNVYEREIAEIIEMADGELTEHDQK